MSHDEIDLETWNEEASDIFIKYGEAFVPWRPEIENAVLRLIPAHSGQVFTAVDVGAGTGWLTRAILAEFPHVRVTALDGSPRMLQEVLEGVPSAIRGRLTVEQFRMQDLSWIDALDGPVRAFVSSLTIHHLEHEVKRELYRRLLERLEPGGALLIADVIAPASPWSRLQYQQSYEADVKARSLDKTGRLDDFQQFLDLEWNLFEFPSPSDKPATILDHLTWLHESGYEGVEVFWARSGHALYGGYKP